METQDFLITIKDVPKSVIKDIGDRFRERSIQAGIDTKMPTDEIQFNFTEAILSSEDDVSKLFQSACAICFILLLENKKQIK